MDVVRIVWSQSAEKHTSSLVDERHPRSFIASTRQVVLEEAFGSPALGFLSRLHFVHGNRHGPKNGLHKSYRYRPAERFDVGVASRVLRQDPSL